MFATWVPREEGLLHKAVGSVSSHSSQKVLELGDEEILIQRIRRGSGSLLGLR